MHSLSAVIISMHRQQGKTILSVSERLPAEHKQAVGDVS